MMTISSPVFSSVVLLTMAGLVLGGHHSNYFCELPCKNGGGGLTMHTVCQRQNSMCGKGLTCGRDFKVVALDDDDREYILDIHNYLRNKVAMGYENRGHQPPAANMKTLTYNKELEFIAQCWINECHEDILVHDKCRRTSEFSWVGQNLANMGSTDPNELDKAIIIKKLTLGWYDEVEEFNASWVDRHEQRDVMVGHYSQLVWADTNEVGCAMSFYSHYDGFDQWYNLKLACNYGPGGNYLGQSVYKKGKPSTKCAGRKVNKRYPGLCGVDISVNQTKNYYNEFFKYYV